MSAARTVPAPQSAAERELAERYRAWSQDERRRSETRIRIDRLALGLGPLPATGDEDA